jgi:membrane carboxypeptidase/penicillin-binding protein
MRGLSARSTTDSLWQRAALTAVAEALVQAREYERAVQVARSITDSDGQARALTAVAEALAQVREYERAVHVARSISDPNGQADALTAVAEALSQAGQIAFARRSLALALQAGHLSTTLPALARLMPSVLAEVAGSDFGNSLPRTGQ